MPHAPCNFENDMTEMGIQFDLSASFGGPTFDIQHWDQGFLSCNRKKHFIGFQAKGNLLRFTQGLEISSFWFGTCTRIMLETQEIDFCDYVRSWTINQSCLSIEKRACHVFLYIILANNFLVSSSMCGTMDARWDGNGIGLHWMTWRQKLKSINLEKNWGVESSGLLSLFLCSYLCWGLISCKGQMVISIKSPAKHLQTHAPSHLWFSFSLFL